jgi:hypothetical protein
MTPYLPSFPRLSTAELVKRESSLIIVRKSTMESRFPGNDDGSWGEGSE